MSDGERSYYDVLGVVPDASQDDIKRAYRRLAKAYHPDVNRDPDADARFKEINEANQILSAPDRRAQYDRLVLMQEMHTEHEQEKRVRYEEWRQDTGRGQAEREQGEKQYPKKYQVGHRQQDEESLSALSEVRHFWQRIYLQLGP